MLFFKLMYASHKTVLLSWGYVNSINVLHLAAIKSLSYAITSLNELDYYVGECSKLIYEFPLKPISILN